MNVGLSTTVLKKDLKMLGDLAQGDKAKFQELTSIFSKIQSTGKASSIQLQQLALRGIPINKTLKEMGVTGVASAEQLTEAFEKLTGVGGQFHDAMNNIIDTIEGKRGFITDTLKEINVNLGELTGLTAGYKKSLDIVYDIVDAVNNKLMAMNENPMTKAIVRGVLTASVTALSVSIGVGLVGAIKTLNARLKETVVLKSILNPTSIALAVGIGAVTGLAVALETATGKANEYVNAIKEVDGLAEKYGVKDVKVSKAQKAIKKGTATTQDRLAVAVDELTSSKLFEKTFQMQYNEGNKSAWADLQEQKKITAEKQKQVDELSELLQLEEKRKNNSKTIKELYQEQSEEFDKLTKSLGSYATEYSKTAKDEAELNDIIEKRNKLMADVAKQYHGFDEKGVAIDLKLDAESKKKYQSDLKALNDKYKELKVKITTANFSEWQSVLQKVMNFTDDEILSGTLNSGAVAVSAYMKKLNKELSNMQAYSDAGLINVSKLDLAEQKLEKINSLIQAMRDSGLWGADEGTTSMLKALQAGATEQVFFESLRAKQEELAILKDQSGELAKQAQIKALMNENGWSENQAEVCLEWQKKVTEEELKQKDIMGWLVKVITDKYGKTMGEIAQLSFDNVVSSFQTIGNALAKGVDVGKALKQQFLSYVSEVMKHISILCIEAGVKLIAQSGWKGVPPALALFALGGASGIASGVTSAVAQGTSEDNERQKQLDLLKSLNEQYKDLSKAIKEQEEYYIKQKAKLNMYALDDKVTRVNDMILTPNGRFSTNPNDTIIATKNPQGLGGGKVVNNIKVINNAGVEVQTSERQNGNGINELIVTISKKIASDVAGGYNGWDSAMAMQQQRISGRRI